MKPGVKPAALAPARIHWAEDGTPEAPDFGDVYHARVGTAAQARHVFLGGNALPGRWAGCSDFTIAETGFGLGNNFIAAWQAWRDDPQRSTRLHYVAVEAHPPSHADLQRAHATAEAPSLAAQLLAVWPPLVGGLHRLDFEHGAVQLLLAFGDVRQLLPALDFQADAFFLDGFAPARNAAMWERRVIQALSRRARPGATAATWSVARELRDNLSAAGFDWSLHPGIGGKREVLHARHAPRPGVSRRSAPPRADERRAVVVGAGLAGACVAASLAGQGFEVVVLERQAEPAGGSSGNPAGLFHATVHADDNPYARLFRAAALHTARLVRGLPVHEVPHEVDGLLRLELTRTVDGMRALVERLGLPADLVQVLDTPSTSQRAGLPLPAPAWHYPCGGWVAPAALVRERLQRPCVSFRGGQQVHALRRDGPHWVCVDADGQPLAAAPHVVLATADQANALLGSIGAPAFPWLRNRGQVSVLPQPATWPRLRLPVAGAGYAVPLPDGRLLCGASTRPDGDDTAVLASDHLANHQRLQALFGLPQPDDVARWEGRVGWRVQTVDRLPVAGPLAARPVEGAAAIDQCRRVPREPGLHLACAFGARGITLAPLLADVVAARIAGNPVPLPQDLVDLVDPARWLVRAVRRPGAPARDPL